MKRQSAFNRALQEAQNGETVKPLNSETVEQPNSETVKQLNSKTVKSELVKASFYIRADQQEKLDDLAHECKKRKGKRVDRQDIIRALIDDTSLEQVLRLLRTEP